MWTRVLRAWPLAPAFLSLFLPWLYLSTTTRPGVEAYFPPLDDPRAKYEAPLERLANIPSAIAGSFQDKTDNALLATWALAVTAAAWAGRRQGEATNTRGGVALAAAAVACYFVLPIAIQGQWNIAQRFAWITALLLPSVIIHRPPRWIAFAVLALSAATAANAAWHHVLFDREVGPFDRALAAIRPGARVLGLIYDSRGSVLERSPYLHFEQYAVVQGGGVAAHSFTANAPLPVRLRPLARVPMSGVWRPDEFLFSSHGPFFDHFIIRDPTGRHGLRRPYGSSVYEVFREGAWRVYRGRSGRTQEDES